MSDAWSKVTVVQSGTGYRVWFERQRTTEAGLTTSDVLVRELEGGDRNMVYLLDALYDVAYPTPPGEAAMEVEIGPGPSEQ